jgi:hypothetical protein
MKQLLFSLLVLVVSCTPNPNSGGSVPTSKLGDFTVKIIDSCEYIEYSQAKLGEASSTVYTITHKGNCSHCIEKLKSIVNQSKNK